jgi:hypothetical protein
MRDVRKYRIFPSNLSLPKALEATSQKLSDLGYVEADPFCPHTDYRAILDGTRTISANRWVDFLKLINLHPRPERILVHSHWTCKDRKDVELFMDVLSERLEFTVGSDDAAVLEFLHRALQELFSAPNPAPEKSESLSKWSLKKTVFLAHRFDEEGRATASSVHKFLARCGFSVIEGEGYEAGPIPAKVAERIEKQDILLAIFTAGNATWVASEAAYAHGQRKYIVRLAEKDLDITKGILGADYEHLTFPKGNVEKAFSDLLYALPS